jgi:nucleotide-binding universal stress UspA family protein
MSEESMHRSPIRRILVALDASPSSLHALQTAVDLASRFKAEVHGLFVEDINLLRLAELPMAREICFYSSRVRRLSPLELESQLRIQAARIRIRLSQAADAQGVPWKFRIARGAVGAEVLSAGAAADLVILGKLGRSLPGMHRTGSTVKTLLMQRRGMTLVLQTRVQLARTPVTALFDGTPTARRAVGIAAYLTQRQEAPLIVMVVAPDAAAVEEFQDRAAKQVEALGMQAVFRPVVRPSLSDLALKIQLAGKGPVVLPCSLDWLDGEKLCSLVDEIANPVLLIR